MFLKFYFIQKHHKDVITSQVRLEAKLTIKRKKKKKKKRKTLQYIVCDFHDSTGDNRAGELFQISTTLLFCLRVNDKIRLNQV